MRKRVLFTGAVLAIVLLLGSTSAAFAASGPVSQSHGWTSVAEQLHLSASDISSMRQEILSGASVSQVLAQYNITMDQIRNALASVNPSTDHLSNTHIASIAAKLGLNSDEIAADIASGKSLKQILASHNITGDQLHAVFAEHMG